VIKRESANGLLRNVFEWGGDVPVNALSRAQLIVLSTVRLCQAQVDDGHRDVDIFTLRGVEELLDPLGSALLALWQS
jgi:hypothetical protein